MIQGGGGSQGRKFIRVTLQDSGSGLASVSATRLTNATLSVPDFTLGTQAPVVVTAYRVNQTLGTVVSLDPLPLKNSRVPAAGGSTHVR